MSAPIQLNAGPRYVLISCIPQFSAQLLFVMTWLSQGSFHLNTPGTEGEWSFLIYFISLQALVVMRKCHRETLKDVHLTSSALLPQRQTEVHLLTREAWSQRRVYLFEASPSETELLVHHAQINSSQNKIEAPAVNPDLSDVPCDLFSALKW